MAFIPGATGVGFYNALEDGAKAEATKLGYTFLYQGSPDFTPAAQTPVVNAVCAKHPKILLIAPTDPVALRPAIQTCMSAGVKVVTVDTSLTNTSGLVSAITSNNIQGGEAAASRDRQGPQGPRPGRRVQHRRDHHHPGRAGPGPQEEGWRAYPGISIVSSQFTGQPETVSETDTKAVMTSHPQVKALFGAAETNAEGAAQALSSLGATGKLTVVGYDADPSAVSLLKTGAISALVIQQPAREGQLGVEYGNDALTGHTSLVKTSVLLPNILVTTAQAGIGPTPSTTTPRLPDLAARRPARPARRAGPGDQTSLPSAGPREAGASMRKSIATVSVSGTLPEKLAAIAQARFQGVEIFESDLVNTPFPAEHIRDQAADLGLSVEAYQPFRDFEAMPPTASRPDSSGPSASSTSWSGSPRTPCWCARTSPRPRLATTPWPRST